MAQVTGVEQNLLVRLPPLRCSERDAVETPGQALDDRKQLERAERLQQERVGPGFHALGLGAVGAGKQDDRNPLRLGVGFELAAEGEPVHSRHPDVQDDRIGLSGRDRRCR